MFETMYQADGVGLAAPQVGILKRIVAIDVGDGNQYVLINPEIIEQSGEQTGYEGCLSVPGKTGIVTRPNHVKVRALDAEMNPFELEGEELLARAICHECAHLDGPALRGAGGRGADGCGASGGINGRERGRIKMRIVFMGTPDFAVPSLAALAGAGHEIAAVVTQPDKQKGRGKAVQMTPVKAWALDHGIPVYQPVKVRDPEFVKLLQGIAPQVIVVAAFGQILSKEILTLPPYGCVNIHASLLPKYRGRLPSSGPSSRGRRRRASPPCR